MIRSATVDPHQRADSKRQPLADRIQQLETELAALKRQQRQELVATIRTVVAPGVVFSAIELWAVSPALQAAFDDAGIRSVKQLGKHLRQLRGHGIERVGEDRTGILWTVEVDFHFHQGSVSAR